MKRTLRLAAAAATAFAVALIGTGTLSAAHANPGVIDPAATVTLNVHKYLGAASSVAGTGATASVPGDYRALEGVDFDVHRVFLNAARTTPVDLTTNAGWAAASAITGKVLTQAEILAGQFVIGSTTYYLGTKTTEETDEDGLATFSPLGGVGFYLVNENLATSGTITSRTQAGGDPQPVTKSQVSPAAPFFVTLPATNPTGDGWMYTVDVYPKNQADQVTKTVTDLGTTTQNGSTGRDGDHTLRFTITSGITDGMDATRMGTYVITDDLDNRLMFESLTVGIDADGDPASGTPTALVLDTDYTVTPSPRGVTAGEKIVITLTPAGLQKLVTANAANAAATVVTTIDATVLNQGALGQISNQAYVIPNQAWLDANPGEEGVPTNADPANENGVPTRSAFGDLRLTKENPDGDPLSGAEFAVYEDLASSQGGDGTRCSNADVTGTVLATGTTDGDGLLTISGLQTSDFYNGSTQVEADHLGYCLVETKAPSGYNLKAEPIPFKVLYSASALAVVEVTVVNQAFNLGNALPFTGGQGIGMLSILGALLLALGLLWYVLSSRRRREV